MIRARNSAYRNACNITNCIVISEEKLLPFDNVQEIQPIEVLQLGVKKQMKQYSICMANGINLTCNYQECILLVPGLACILLKLHSKIHYLLKQTVVDESHQVHETKKLKTRQEKLWVAKRHAVFINLSTLNGSNVAGKFFKWNAANQKDQVKNVKNYQNISIIHIPIGLNTFFFPPI